jgi:hypothetical protein
MIDVRFDPIDFSNIPGFPNPMRSIGVWGVCLPRFIEDEDDNPTHHLIEFHLCMHQPSIFHEDILMKMFMISLEGDAHNGTDIYTRCLYSYSLKDFHILFHSRYKMRYPIEIIFENYCNEVFKSVSR